MSLGEGKNIQMYKYYFFKIGQGALNQIFKTDMLQYLSFWGIQVMQQMKNLHLTSHDLL